MKKYLILCLAVMFCIFMLFGCGIGLQPSEGGQSQTDRDSDSLLDSDSVSDSTTDSESITDSDSTSDSDIGGEEKIMFKVLHGNFIESGGGQLSLSSNSLAVADGEFDGISLSASVCPGGSATDNGIVFAFSSEKEENVWEGAGISYYFYFISRGGTAYLGKTSNGKWTLIGEKAIKNFSSLNTYALKAEYFNNTIYCYLDGSLNAIYTDNSPLSGKKYGIRAGGTGVTISEITAQKVEEKPSEPIEGFEVISGGFTADKNTLFSTQNNSLAVKSDIYENVSVSVQTPIPNVGYSGIVFGYGEDGNGTQSYYLYAVNSDRYVGLYKSENGILSEIKKTSLVAKYSVGTVVNLEVRICADGVYTYIDEVCLVCRPDLFVSGKAGVYTAITNNVLSELDIKEGGERIKADLIMWGHSHMQLWDNYKADLDGYGKVVNMGIGGSDTVYWSKLISEINSYEADKMVVMTGSNDYGNGASAEMVLKYVDQIFTALISNNPQLKIVLIDEFLQPCRLQYTEVTNKLNQYYFMYASENSYITVVDSYDIVLNADGSLNEGIFRDIYHMKKEGYDALTPRVRDALDGKYKHDEISNYDVISGGFSNAGDGSIVSNANNSFALRKAVSQKRAEITLKARLSGENGQIGLVFAYENANYFKFVYNNSEMSLIKADGVGEAVVKSVPNNAFSAEITLTVSHKDGEIKCFVGEECVIEYFDEDSVSGGRIGVEASENTTVLSMSMTALAGKYNFTVGSEDSWQISKDSSGNYVYTSMEKGVMFMFNDLRFSGGTIEFDMIVNAQTNEHKYLVANGIVFGANTLDATINAGTYYVFGRCPWGNMTGFAKNYGAFNWEDKEKVLANVPVGNIWHYKYVYDNVNGYVMIYLNGALKDCAYLQTTFESGPYVGIWCDSENTVISNLTFTEQVFQKAEQSENNDFVSTEGDSRAWKVTVDGSGIKTYTCLSSNQMIMFKDKTFGGGIIEFDMTVYGQTDDHKFYVANGVVFGSDNPLASANKGSYYVFGRCPWGSMTGFAKQEGEFNWEDTKKTFVNSIQSGITHHYKFKWNKAENNIYLYTSENEYIICPLKKSFSGQYVGLYISAPGTEITNLTFVEE